MKNCLKKNSGFTILEVVAVLAILGIISALAVSTISININDIKGDEQLNVLKAHLRYAQARAMNSDSEWGIQFDTTNNKYWLFKGTDQDDKIRLPGEEKKDNDDDKLVVMSDLSITSISTGDDFVVFNTLGSPVVIDSKGKLVSVATEITIATSEKDITIKANTGFIE